MFKTYKIEKYKAYKYVVEVCNYIAITKYVVLETIILIILQSNMLLEILIKLYHISNAYNHMQIQLFSTVFGIFNNISICAIPEIKPLILECL
jgi:hypothetical protein